MVLTDLLTSIADAIRKKDGTDEKIYVKDMPQRILNVPVGTSLPSFIETGTFSFDENTIGPVTIRLSGEPIEFFYLVDECLDIESVKHNMIVGASSLYKTNAICASASGRITRINYSNGYGITIQDDTVTFKTVNGLYPFFAGLTYRWFAWIKEKNSV